MCYSYIKKCISCCHSAIHLLCSHPLFIKLLILNLWSAPHNQVCHHAKCLVCYLRPTLQPLTNIASRKAAAEPTHCFKNPSGCCTKKIMWQLLIHLFFCHHSCSENALQSSRASRSISIAWSQYLPSTVSKSSFTLINILCHVQQLCWATMPLNSAKHSTSANPKFWPWIHHQLQMSPCFPCSQSPV